MPVLHPEQINVDTEHHFEFEPTGVVNGLASYQGVYYVPDPLDPLAPAVAINTAPALQATMTISLQKPSKTSRISKARMKIVLPEPVLDNGVATSAKDHENSADVTFMFSERATDAERAKVFNAFVDALTNMSTIRSVTVDHKSIY
jgi:hypothetical protein